MIGVYDSGLGGILEIKKIMADNPGCDLLFLGDQKNVPYGNKTKTALRQIFTKNLQLFKQYRVQDLILVCNTLCSVVDRQKDYGLRLHDIITKTVAQVNCAKEAKILLFATPLTIALKRYQQELKARGYLNVKAVALPDLAADLEHFLPQEEIKAKLTAIFKTIDYQPDYLILGCTHFPIVEEIFTEYYRVPCYNSKELDYRVMTAPKGEKGIVHLLLEENPDNKRFIAQYLTEAEIVYEH